ncbi:hypothetical protein ACSSNL_02210 [Thalassobius sp. S69A]|uniref:hypothetical protein n=1 Tax=unclassified Thalassovita TaxID=2619711 RepID=UPI000C38A750|nr:hypothetical protein [Paracoccaceae bacterium]
MKRIVASLAAASLIVAPALASDLATDEDEGFSLMEEGAKLFMRGIMQEMEPAMDDLRAFADTMEPAMRQFVREMGPALAEVLKKVDDLTLYHPPEMLPNGDIIMRRKQPAPPQPPQSIPQPGPEGEVEL